MSGRETQRITETPGVCGGKACVTWHRIRVMDIAIRHEHMGMGADEVVAAYHTITLGDVHAALATTSTTSKRYAKTSVATTE